MIDKMKVGVAFHSYIVDKKKHNITVDEAIEHTVGFNI